MVPAARRPQPGIMTTFGLHLTSYPGPDAGSSVAAYVRHVAAAAENSGVFSALWLTDHVQNPGPAAAAPESHLVLAAVAACTQRLGLGLLATSVVYRNPALLAKMITTVDVLSGGRAILGIGAGHPRTQAEAESYGYTFPPIGARMEMLDHALEIIRPMIDAEPADGTPPNWPRPLRPGGIPVLVAGSGEQRLLRIAARHADMINLSLPSGDSLARIPHKLDILRQHCATIGRDPAQITVTYKATMAVAESRQQARAGWDHWGPRFGLGEPAAEAGAFVGEAADIADMVRPFLDAGVGHLIVELAGGAEPESIALAAKALAPLMPAAARWQPRADAVEERIAAARSRATVTPARTTTSVTRRQRVPLNNSGR
jgi:alkanesulfonate monooxygenase SsuD/methylene tetrahydromethanopterin reductase-like flavin-dependent oxidoreductase (luciferase family)